MSSLRKMVYDEARRACHAAADAYVFANDQDKEVDRLIGQAIKDVSRAMRAEPREYLGIQPARAIYDRFLILLERSPFRRKPAEFRECSRELAGVS